MTSAVNTSKLVRDSPSVGLLIKERPNGWYYLDEIKQSNKIVYIQHRGDVCLTHSVSRKPSILI